MEIAKAIKLTRLFFKERFPEKDIDFEIACGYFGEWVERIMSENPEAYMDHKSREAWEKVCQQERRNDKV